jgi:hypothetical protein
MEALSTRFWMKFIGQVSHIVPPSCHAPLLTPLPLSPSLQQPSMSSPHHTPSIYMPYRRFYVHIITGLSMPISHPPLPFPSLFLASELPGSWWVHVLTSPHVYIILPCINIIYLTAFSCPSKLFSFGSNIDREAHISQKAGY